jgi:predicted acylesterase/phospholipase RssA
MPDIDLVISRLNELRSRWERELDFDPLRRFARAVAPLAGRHWATSQTGPQTADDLRASGPYVASVLREHSVFRGENATMTTRELFADVNPRLDTVRQAYGASALLFATAILLSNPPVGDRRDELAARIGFGLDPESALFRSVLFGALGRRFDDLRRGMELPPPGDLFSDILTSTCMVGVSHALNEFGRAVENAPREWPGVIERIDPGRGCAGDAVEIWGRNFELRQPADVTLVFTRYTGGFVSAAATSWSDTRILTNAPPDVGNGPVGFIRGSVGISSGVGSAATQLAGEVESCLGFAASRFAYGLRHLASSLDAPKIVASAANRFAGGKPKIVSFTGNGTVRVMLRRLDPLVVRWATDNADTVQIQASGSPELPPIPGVLPSQGEFKIPSIQASGPWTGQYTLICANSCGQVQQTLDVEVKERLALVLAGGGSKGSFEVGAARCLQDVFGIRPDVICGASVGSLNAAKLAEGAGAIQQLEALWLNEMRTPSDLYLPTGYVVRIVQALASLGIKTIGSVDLATLLNVRLADFSTIAALDVGLGRVNSLMFQAAGAGIVSLISDVVLEAAKVGMTLGRLVSDIQHLVASQSLFAFEPVRSKIDRYIDSTKISASGIELRIATVNLNDGRIRFVDQRGRFTDDGSQVSLADALQASASIPVAFPPVPLPGGVYVDGGVRENVALQAADEAGATTVIAVLPSPIAMVAASFASESLFPLVGRSAEAIFDELLRNELAPFRGYNVPVTVIAPMVEPHNLLKVDPGLVRIMMHYGYMRAFDEMHPDGSKRGQLRQLSTDIFVNRRLVWGPLEHASEGKIMDEEAVAFAAVGLQAAASADDLAEVRRVKLEIRRFADERQTLVNASNANPSGIESAWQQWEEHSWLPTIVSPWSASYAHAGQPLQAAPIPPALPPLP